MDVNDYIVDGKLKIVVKTNAPKTKITEFDKTRNALKLDVHALPKKGKANAEIIKFFSRKLKKKVVIVSGLTSKTKLLKLC